MKYKLIAMDMDGTLLNSSKEVSERSKEALKRASELGVKLVVCTGRIFTSARLYADLIGTSAPIIASNGAYIREKDREEIIYEKNLAPDKVMRMIELAEAYGFYPHVFTSDSIFTKKIIHFSANYNKWNESVPDKLKVKIELVEEFNEVITRNKDSLIKLVVMSEDIDNLSRLRSEILKEMKVSIMSSSINNFEVMDDGVSKGSGVKQLASFFGFSPEEIICIGDNENDISMIEYAGLGIAMGNAENNIKSIANYVTDTNDEDGVAKAIEKFVLNC